MLATIYRRSPSAFATLADVGITRQQDFEADTWHVF
jgi:hypothetical protein